MSFAYRAYKKPITLTRVGLSAQGIVLTTALLLAATAQQAWPFAQGWSEEKRLLNVSGQGETSGTPPPVVCDITASGDDIYVACGAPLSVVGEPGNGVVLLISRDRGKTWSEPRKIFSGNASTPAIAADGDNVLMVWPAEEFDGDVRVNQLFYCVSVDAGTTWTDPAKAHSTSDNSFSPRLLKVGQKMLMAWVELPAIDISTGTPLELTPEAIDMSTMQMQNRGATDTSANATRVAIHCCDFLIGQQNFSPARQVASFFANAAPQSFGLARVDGGILLAYNRNYVFEFQRSRDQGTTWRRQSATAKHFNPIEIVSFINTPDGPEAISIARKPFSPVVVQYFKNETKTDITAPIIVRSLPRIAESDGDRHVIWGGGRQYFTWVSYMRTDKVTPTSVILEPKDKRIRDLNMRIAWEGDDNISNSSELLYSYRFDEKPWSEFMPDTELETESPEDGDHTFEIRVEDVAGNVQDPPSEIEFNTNDVAPETAITNLSRTQGVIADRVFLLEFEGKDNTDSPSDLSYEVKLDNGAWEAAETSTKHTFERLSNGQHRLSVRAKDRVGNTDLAPAVATITVRVGIEVTFTTVPEPRTEADPIVYQWEGHDATDSTTAFTYFYKLDENEPKSEGSSTTLSLDGIEEGAHTIHVWAVDSAGNKSPEIEHSIFIDRTPPTTIAEFRGGYSSSNYPEVYLRGEDTPPDEDGNPLRVSVFEYRIDDQPEWREFNFEAGDIWIVPDKRLSLFDIGYVVHVRAKDESHQIGNPVSVDLRLWVRSPMVVYIAGGIVGLIVLVLLVMLLKRLGQRKRRSALLDKTDDDDPFSTDSSSSQESEESTDSNDPFA